MAKRTNRFVPHAAAPVPCSRSSLLHVAPCEAVWIFGGLWVHFRVDGTLALMSCRATTNGCRGLVASSAP